MDVVVNVQLSAESGEWYTPHEWVEKIHAVFPWGFWDPATSAMANLVMGAVRWGCDALSEDWVYWGPFWFCNPPGSCPRLEDGTFSVCGNATRCSCKLPRRMLYRALSQSGEGIFLMFSVNQLRTLAGLDVPQGKRLILAVPTTRIPYLDPQTLTPKRGTSFDSAFLFVGHTSADTFVEVFRGAGCMIWELTP